MLALIGFAVAAGSARSEADTIKIVAFGTSLTARGGWPKPLRAALASCLGRPVQVVTIAKSGST